MKKILGYILMFGGLFICIFAIYADILLYRNSDLSLSLAICYLLLYGGAGVLFFLLGRRLLR